LPKVTKSGIGFVYYAGGDVLDFGLGIGVYGWDSERWPESTPTFSTKKIQKKWLKNTQFPRFSNIL